jgi:hypothetical protein
MTEVNFDIVLICSTNAAAMANNKNKAGRPRTRGKNLDTNYSMRVSTSDRDEMIAAADALGYSLNKFTNECIMEIVALLNMDEKDLPHSKDIRIVALGRFLKNHPTLRDSVKF